MEAAPRFELGIKDLQSSALPLGYAAAKESIAFEFSSVKDIMWHMAVIYGVRRGAMAIVMGGFCPFSNACLPGFPRRRLSWLPLCAVYAAGALLQRINLHINHIIDS